MQKLSSLSLGLFLLTGCGASNDGGKPLPAATADCTRGETADVTALKQKIAALEKENADLKLTPAALATEVKKQVEAGSVVKANEQLELLKKRYPGSKEVGVAEKDISALVARQKAAETEAERRRLLGFKALGTKTLIDTDEVKVTVESVGIGSQWVFDDHGHEYSYQEAPRGSKYILAKLSVSTKGSGDPKLPGIAAYVQNGDTLEHIETGRYRFTRWMDYGSYLGNGHDFRNDFKHSSKIPFNFGIEIDETHLKKPVFIIASNEGCFSRIEERFGHPPVSYVGGNCAPSLKNKLTVSDFSEGKLFVVKTFGAGSK